MNLSLSLSIASSAVSSSWTPATASPLLWLRADSGVTSPGGLLTWTDVLGEGGLHVDAGSTFPTLSAASVGGQDAFAFDGTDEFQSGTNLMSAGSAYSVLMVGKVTTTPAVGNGGVLTLRKSTPCAACELRQVPDMIVHADEVNGANNCTLSTANSTAVATAIQSNFQAVWKMAGAGQAPVLYVNGTAYTMASGVQGTESGDAGYTIGSTPSGINFVGLIAEIVVVSGAISDADRSGWGTYVLGRYGF